MKWCMVFRIERPDFSFTYLLYYCICHFVAFNWIDSMHQLFFCRCWLCMKLGLAVQLVEVNWGYVYYSWHYPVQHCQIFNHTKSKLTELVSHLSYSHQPFCQLRKWAIFIDRAGQWDQIMKTYLLMQGMRKLMSSMTRTENGGKSMEALMELLNESNFIKSSCCRIFIKSFWAGAQTEIDTISL